MFSAGASLWVNWEDHSPETAHSEGIQSQIITQQQTVSGRQLCTQIVPSGSSASRWVGRRAALAELIPTRRDELAPPNTKLLWGQTREWRGGEWGLLPLPPHSEWTVECQNRDWAQAQRRRSKQVRLEEGEETTPLLPPLSLQYERRTFSLYNNVGQGLKPRPLWGEVVFFCPLKTENT